MFFVFLQLGIKKKLLRVAKTKECDIIGEGIKSIINHLHWSAATASNDDDIVKRWKSLVDHLCNEHDDCYHDPLDTLEDDCYHDPLDTLEVRRKKWLTPGNLYYILYIKLF